MTLELFEIRFDGATSRVHAPDARAALDWAMSDREVLIDLRIDQQGTITNDQGRTRGFVRITSELGRYSPRTREGRKLKRRVHVGRVASAHSS
jgi:hypothetical protein